MCNHIIRERIINRNNCCSGVSDCKISNCPLRTVLSCKTDLVSVPDSHLIELIGDALHDCLGFLVCENLMLGSKSLKCLVIRIS